MTLQEFHQKLDALNRKNGRTVCACSPIDNGTVEVTDLKYKGLLRIFLTSGKIKTMRDGMDPELYKLCFDLAHSKQQM